MSDSIAAGELQEVIQGTMVTLTDEAAAKIKPALERFSASGLRITAKQDEQGVATYGFDLEQGSRPDDLVVEENGIKIFVDPGSAPHLQGMEIHYIETEQGPGFAIVDPSTTCGCGTGGSCGCSR